MPVSIFRWQRSLTPWRAAAAWSALKDALEIADAQGTEDQNRRAHTCLAQNDAFLDVRAGEHRRARLFEREADLRRTMAIGIRLDNSDHLRRVWGLTPLG
jgi:hypothetical protein